MSSDGNIAASDVLRGSEGAAAATSLSCPTALPGLRVVRSLQAMASTPFGACEVECEARLSHASLEERTPTRLPALELAPSGPRPLMRFAPPVAGELPARIDLAQADGHRDVLRICARGGAVRAVIIDCYGPAGTLDAAYLATAWRGEDGVIYVDGRHASVIGRMALSWSPDSMRIPPGAGAETRDDAGQSLHWAQVPAIDLPHDR